MARHLSCIRLFALFFVVTHACTDLLVTPGASVDGSAMVTYNADSPLLFGTIYHYPATASNTTSTRPIFDWDSGSYLGEIDEATSTYNVVGNTNEAGLVIGESTFGGVAPLAWNQSGAVMDYGSLIYITLQRSATCLEAIQTMVDLMDTYGYASGGESLSITDATGDVWMMELIGRGSDYGKLGAVYVAVKIPDGAVAAHANQARIQTFPRDDPDNCLYAKDVVDVAVFYGLYPSDGDPAGFSFSDVYHPVNFMGARQGDARVWSMFSQIADADGTFQRKYLGYASGEDLNPTSRMPLYIYPYQKLSLMDVSHLMASHYEMTPLDSSQDVGAGLFGSPYRPRPLVWTYNGTRYHNERSVATTKSGWSIVGQVRPWMPQPLAAILWFAADDSSTSPRVPVYSSSTRIAPAYAGKGAQDGVTTPLLQLDLDKAFWVQNMVSNFCYYRWSDAYPMLRKKLDQVQEDFESKVAAVDQQAMTLYDDKDPSKAIDYVTFTSVRFGQSLHKEWMTFYGELFVRFRDFFTIVPNPDRPICGCEAIEPGLSVAMEARIVRETGNRYKVPDTPGNPHVWQGEAGPPPRYHAPTKSNLEADA